MAWRVDSCRDEDTQLEGGRNKMLCVTIIELKVSPKVVSQSGEKRFENTGSSRSSKTDLQLKRQERVRTEGMFRQATGDLSKERI